MGETEESSLIQHLGRQMIQDLLEDDETVRTLIDELDSDSNDKDSEVEDDRRRGPNIDRDRYNF